MTPRRTATAAPAEPEAPVIRSCRNCRRPLDEGRRVFCSLPCIETVDQRAAQLGPHLAALQAQFDQESAAVEQEIAQFAFERRRILRGRQDHLMAMGAELAPLKSALSDAKAAGEIRFALASEGPAETGWR